ncbi:MAG TPA: CPBP family intramembrane glutamic endopeptidase [Terriglobales bacterium]|nr:CPBP family intramembrane glutamic endopeptidase [Terriglobales bacterium]
MPSESKSFPPLLVPSTVLKASVVSGGWLWTQIVVVYGLILVSIWTPQGIAKIILMLAAAIALLIFAGDGSYSWREMGLGLPSARAWLVALAAGMALAVSVPMISRLVGLNVAPFRSLSLQQSWRYAIWSLEQEFILQSFLFLRLETLTRSRHAVLWAAALFSLAHLPSPILTVLSLIGGLVFCEIFRRYRNIYPLGVIHAVLGLTIAGSFSDRWLHHMRVGIGYLTFHLR